MGSAPIDALARAEAIQAEAPDPYEPLSGRTNAPYSQALLKGIDHALAFESTRRPQSVSEWREDLKLHATHTWAIKVKDSSRASVNLEDVPTLPSTRRWGSVVNLGHDRGGDAVSSSHSSGAKEQIPPATAGHVSRWLDRGGNVALGVAFAGVGLMFALVADNSDPATRTARDVAYTLPTQQPAVASSKQTTRKPRHTPPGRLSSAFQVPKPQLLAGGQPVANATPIPVSTDTPSSTVDAAESVADIRDRSEGEPPRVREFPSALSSPVQAQADPPARVDPPGAGQPQGQVSQDGRLPRVSDPQATDDASASSETNVRTFDTSMTTKPLVVATNETKPSDQRTAQIAQLLAQAGRDVAALRLTVPASGNAFAKYREVLVLDPENSQALNGIASIVYKFVQLIDRAIETRRFGLADLYLRRVVTILPENTSMTTKALVVATDETKPSDQRTAQIAQLLAQADQDIAAMRLTVPASGNAFAKYREVLVLDPENSQALNGIASIVYKYVQLLDRAIETRRFGLADLYLRRAVTLLPENRNPPPNPGNHGR